MKKKYFITFIFFVFIQLINAQTIAISGLSNGQDLTQLNGDLYVSDISGNGQILRYDPSNLSATPTIIANDAAARMYANDVVNNISFSKVVAPVNGNRGELKQVSLTGTFPAASATRGIFTTFALAVATYNGGRMYVDRSPVSSGDRLYASNQTLDFNYTIHDMVVVGDDLYYTNGQRVFRLDLTSTTAAPVSVQQGDFYSITYANNKLYYTALQNDAIRSMNTNGQQVTLIKPISTNANFISSIEVIDSQVYYLMNGASNEVFVVTDSSQVVCTATQNPVLGTVTSTEATVSWDLDIDPSTTYEFSTSVSGNPFGTPTAVNGNIDTYTFNLQPETQYDLKVTKVCSNGQTMDAIFSVTTPAASCLAIQNLTTGTITSNSISVNWDLEADINTTYRVAAIEVGFNGTNTIINSNINTYNFTNLSSNTSYNVTITKVCPDGSTSDTTIMVTTGISRTTIYVDKNATGNNDGSSWANAFTELRAALAAATGNNDIWIAAGIYTPAVNDRTISFRIDGDNVSLYGGFNGTETIISQRDPKVNVTALSGDLNSDDDPNIAFDGASIFGDPSRDDNSNTIIEIRGENTIIEGFTISDGFADGITSGTKGNFGAAIYSNQPDADASIINCIIEDNYAYAGGAGIFSQPNSGTADFILEQCIIRNNASRYGTGLWFMADGTATSNLQITNTLFYNNITRAVGSGAGGAGSSMWLRTLNNAATVNTDIVNCTFIDNKELGGGFTVPNSNKRSTIWTTNINANDMSRLTLNVSNSDFNNNIWNNGNNIITSPIGDVLQTTVNGGDSNITVSNSVDVNGFALITNISNIITTSGIYQDAATQNFAPSSGSSVIDAGNNSLIINGNSLDLNGNPRINNTIVDIGAYEFTGTTAYTLTTMSTGQGTVTPATGTQFNSGSTATLVATPAAGWQFDGWSGDLTSTNTSETLLMDSNKSVTATFSQIQYGLAITIIGQGTVTPVDGSIFNSGDTANLVATPAVGWQFDGWSDDLSSTNINETLLMDTNKSVTATFSIISYKITINVVGQGSVSPGSGVDFAPNSRTTLRATPAAGYQFVGWTGDINSTSNPFPLFVTQDITVTATFSTTASLDDSNKLNFTMYPNPTQNIINIDGEFAYAKAELYNLQGQIIYTTKERILQMNSVPSGIYLLKVWNNQGQNQTQRVIKK